jgi:hypothetical protein
VSRYHFFLSLYLCNNALLSQLYVSLSTMKEWDSVHNGFDLSIFYDHLVRIMRNTIDSKWCKGIMQGLTE